MIKSEAKIQQEIVMWFRNNYCLNHHTPKCLIFSVPNERKDAREMMSMKATGLLSGVSDLIVIIPNEVLFIEVKTDTGKQSDAQKMFENDVCALKFFYHVVRSLDDFQEIIRKKVV